MWENSGLSELSGSVGQFQACRLELPWGVGAHVWCCRYRWQNERRAARRLSTWTRDYLRQVALADLGCAVVGVFIAAQVRFGSDVTAMYLALSLALPVLWIVALWLAGAYDVRFIGTGSDEYRKVLNAGVSLTAAVAIFSYTVNLAAVPWYVVIALPSVTVFDLFARFAMRKRLHGCACAADACTTWWRSAMSWRSPS